MAHTHRASRLEFLEHQRRIGRANARVLCVIDGRGSALARRPALAALATPALVPFRFLRTLGACLGVERGLVLRRPRLAWLCWQGMCAWGRGFVEGAGRAVNAGDERTEEGLRAISARTTPMTRP